VELMVLGEELMVVGPVKCHRQEKLGVIRVLLVKRSLGKKSETWFRALKVKQLEITGKGIF